MPSLPRPFSESWTLSDTEQQYRIIVARPEEPENFKHLSREEKRVHEDRLQEWYRVDYFPLIARLRLCVAEHVQWLVHNGHLSLPLHADNVNSPWFRELRTVLSNPLQPLNDTSIRVLSTLFLQELRFLEPRFHKNQERSESSMHEAMQELMANGNFPFYSCLDSDVLRCQNTGRLVALNFQDWQCTAGMLDTKTSKDVAFLPLKAEDFPPMSVHHAVFPVPSGEIWISDWFRMPAFTEAVKWSEEHASENSVNTIMGCVRHTLRYVQEFGFVSVMVGNSCPTIVARSGRLEFGHLHEEEEDWDASEAENDDDFDDDGDNTNTLSRSPHIVDSANPSCTPLGSVCTDLWWASLIDRQVLEQLLVKHVGENEARLQMAKFESEYSHVLTKVHVPPGDYHVYFAGKPALFQEKFHCSEVDFAPFDSPMFVVSPQPLDWTAEPQPTKVVKLKI